MVSKFKTALYIRISREDGDEKQESNSITNQRNMLQNYIKSHKDDFDLINEYVSQEDEAKKYISYKNINNLTREVMASCVTEVIIHENGIMDISLTCDSEIGELIKMYSADV